jgi:hypothetical protein
MTEVIRDGAGIIAANYLSITGETSVKFRTIAEIKSKLEFLLLKKGFSIYIDTTRDSIINALNNNTDIFDGSFEKYEITCKNKKKLDEMTQRYFNAKIPSDMREDFLKIINESISQFTPESEVK